MTRINTNVSSLNAQKTLARTNQQLQTSMTRLSTGLRINSGKDDPSGMIAAAIQTNDIASMKTAITNTQNGSQLIATADSALGQITNLLANIRSLVTQVGNTAVVDSDMIAANQLQVDSALQAIDRISQVTSFQGQNLLDGTLDFINTAQNIPQIQNLEVDTANLGTTGQLGVTVQVTAHATQADLTTSTGEQKAVGTLSFAARTMFTGNNDSIVASSNSSAYADVTVKVIGSAGGANAATYDANAKILTITGDSTAGTYAAIANTINSDATLNKLFTVNGTGVQAIAAGTVTFTMKQTSLDITASNKGIDYNNVKITVKAGDPTIVGPTAPSATYNEASKELTITLDGAGGAAAGTAVTRWTDSNTLTQIITAITNGAKLADGSQAFTAALHPGGSAGTDRVFGMTNVVEDTAGTSATDVLTVGNTSASGYATSAFTADTRANATIKLATGGKVAFTGGVGADLMIKATSLSQKDNVSVVFMDVGTNKDNESASYDANTNTLTVNMASGASTATASTMYQIINAINATRAFVATDMNGTDDVTTKADFFLNTAPPTNFSTSQDTITVEALNAGANYNNMQIQFELSANLTAPVAAYDSVNNTFIVRINNSVKPADAFTLQQVADAISAVKGFAGSYTTGNVLAATTPQYASGYLFGGNPADASAVANTGVTGGDTLLADLTIELDGNDGQQVLQFKAGDGANQVKDAINAISDSIGVAATQNNGLVDLLSSTYGTKGFIAVNVIQEGAGGTFKQSLSANRTTGTNANATINGIHATSDGNQISINTSMLAMKLDMEPEMDGNFKFNITGGGAQFQLGPDVVSNQQMRIGIQSMNTARLGGVNGRLYQLGQGNNASLAVNPNLGAKIVDEATNAVTTLRGRLGAIQGLTMDTNQKTLEDMVQNMETSLSLIQDTDFAAETAALTRAQILSQSGMSVLSIANQQPQQVLSLLPRG